MMANIQNGGEVMLHDLSRRGVLAGSVVFFFNDTATTEIYTLSLHDALPISLCCPDRSWWRRADSNRGPRDYEDRKSTRLNSSHGYISYAVFCLKKKKIP